MDAQKFVEKGYAILSAENLTTLVELRKKIAHKAMELVGEPEGDIDGFLNNFHKHELRGPSLNSVRLEVIKYCNEELDVGKSFFEAFSGTLVELLGPDLVVQKGTNLVIQQPGDPDVIPSHRDSPPHSPFEVVVWLPLVDVYATKSMYILDRDQSPVALEQLNQPVGGYQEFSRVTHEDGEALAMPFGQALFFWPGLVHSVGVNIEQETRWGLNLRFKNLFSPTGSKGQVEYFELLSLSPLARVALEQEKESRK